jgi:hypothetical protein
MFQSCLKHKDLVKFFNNSIFSLFPKGNWPQTGKRSIEQPQCHEGSGKSTS